MVKIKAITVYCGNSEGRNPLYRQEAEKLGAALAENDIQLIYGAGGTGLMGAVAAGALEKGGKVTGATIRALYTIERPDLVSPKAFIEVWDKMFERKVSMTKKADAICVLPGGFGTLDEFFEMLVLRQLGIFETPIIVVNINGFFNTLRQFLFEIVGEGFVKPHQLELMTFVNAIEEVLPEAQRQLEQQKKGARE